MGLMACVKHLKVLSVKVKNKESYNDTMQVLQLSLQISDVSLALLAFLCVILFKHYLISFSLV